MALMLAFWVLSVVAVGSALAVVFTRNPIYSALNLIVCFFAIAGHYVLLGAEFLALVHVIVYAGAIIVLFLFVIMLMNLNQDTDTQKPWRTRLVAVVVSGVLVVSLVAAVRGFYLEAPEGPLVSGSVSALGMLLFKSYVVPFELASVLFLASIIGVVLVGKRHGSNGEKSK